MPTNVRCYSNSGHSSDALAFAAEFSGELIGKNRPGHAVSKSRNVEARALYFGIGALPRSTMSL